jgi:hypothetical protein
MLVESCNCMFSGIDPVIVGWDKVHVHIVALVVCFNSLGSFVVHYVECGCIPVGAEVGKNVCECCHHGTIVSGWHGTEMDGIQVVKVHHKHILNVTGRLHREGHQCRWCILSWCVSQPMP